MPGTNEPTVVAESASEPVKEEKAKSTTAEEKTQVAEKMKMEVGEADETGGGGDTVENGDKVSGEAKNGGDAEKSSEKSGDVKSEEAANGEKVKTPSKEDFETGASLLAQGKRHLYVKDYPSAVAALSEACAKISAEHGQMADDCADGYYYYGSALLELAREEMAVLGEPEANKEPGDEDEEDEEEEGGEEEAGDETLEASKIEKKGEEGAKKDEEVGEADGEEGKEGEEKKEGEEAKEEEGDENVNDLQLAWEMFDLARVIYERQNNEKKLADTYLKLGEVAMESENYDGAVQDMNKCLTLQHKMLSPDNRAIAETLFQLGVASSLCNQFDEAIKYFTNAGVVLERRIRILTSNKTADPENLKKDPFYTVEKEIDELKALLPEIKDKIADMEDFKREAMKALREDLGNRLANKDGAGCSTSSTGAGSSSSSAAENGADSAVSASPSKAAGPVNDISHLVRKKRKADEVVSEKETSEAKKPNVETPSS
ncbi:hypothetical protein LSTR_LSTR008629 [Laodelphax striatellus]|uniref:Tetratricopeptide SHNi-TPR domain-containing protein n=1 Tax=Laodelphax striatellus TaxID=195883 RepID=A0A482WM72_LAOST|nr:hypothetical protein LSTR_LSTR008629 [Laodelphax striatellus]